MVKVLQAPPVEISLAKSSQVGYPLVKMKTYKEKHNHVLTARAKHEKPLDIVTVVAMASFN